MLIIRADIPLRVCRGNGEAALQGPVVYAHRLLCVCVAWCMTVWGQRKASSQGARGRGGTVIDVGRCARRAETGCDNPKFSPFRFPTVSDPPTPVRTRRRCQCRCVARAILWAAPAQRYSPHAALLCQVLIKTDALIFFFFFYKSLELLFFTWISSFNHVTALTIERLSFPNPDLQLLKLLLFCLRTSKGGTKRWWRYDKMRWACLCVCVCRRLCSSSLYYFADWSSLRGSLLSWFN